MTATKRGKRRILVKTPGSQVYSPVARGNKKEGAGRVPGLSNRNCADIFNNLIPRGTKVSAINVTTKPFFERLYLVPQLRKIAPFVTKPSAPTSPPYALRQFLDFCAIFLPSGPSNFVCQHDSPSNPTESRYPRRRKRDETPTQRNIARRMFTTHTLAFVSLPHKIDDDFRE